MKIDNRQQISVWFWFPNWKNRLLQKKKKSKIQFLKFDFSRFCIGFRFLVSTLYISVNLPIKMFILGKKKKFSIFFVSSFFALRRLAHGPHMPKQLGDARIPSTCVSRTLFHFFSVIFFKFSIEHTLVEMCDLWFFLVLF